ncbi:hypothetical protein HPB47_012944 [Ixodes persulcatus]|uniref:Uncharacterized protein n=1 Tax=Ixodes persulcatus TaxID=34615 RepID=A0AC60NS31_IXOPE|nr:hypothetical protein HPB47_012944 [Ixodes persulcatus]
MLRLGVYADKHHQSFAPSNIIHHVEMRSIFVICDKYLGKRGFVPKLVIKIQKQTKYKKDLVKVQLEKVDSGVSSLVESDVYEQPVPTTTSTWQSTSTALPGLAVPPQSSKLPVGEVTTPAMGSEQLSNDTQFANFTAGDVRENLVVDSALNQKTESEPQLQTKSEVKTEPEPQEQSQSLDKQANTVQSEPQEQPQLETDPKSQDQTASEEEEVAVEVEDEDGEGTSTKPIPGEPREDDEDVETDDAEDSAEGEGFKASSAGVEDTGKESNVSGLAPGDVESDLTIAPNNELRAGASDLPQEAALLALEDHTTESLGAPVQSPSPTVSVASASFESPALDSSAPKASVAEVTVPEKEAQEPLDDSAVSSSTTVLSTTDSTPLHSSDKSPPESSGTSSSLSELMKDTSLGLTELFGSRSFFSQGDTLREISQRDTPVPEVTESTQATILESTLHSDALGEMQSPSASSVSSSSWTWGQSTEVLNASLESAAAVDEVQLQSSVTADSEGVVQQALSAVLGESSNVPPSDLKDPISEELSAANSSALDLPAPGLTATESSVPEAAALKASAPETAAPGALRDASSPEKVFVESQEDQKPALDLYWAMAREYVFWMLALIPEPLQAALEGLLPTSSSQPGSLTLILLCGLLGCSVLTLYMHACYVHRRKESSLTGKISSLEQRLFTLVTEKQVLTEQLEQARSQAETARSELQEREQRVKTLQEEGEELESCQRERDKMVRELRATLSERTEQLEASQKLLAQKECLVTELEADAEWHRENEASLEEKLREATEERLAWEERAEEARASEKQLETRLAEATLTGDHLWKELDAVKRREQSLSADLEAITQDAAKVAQQVLDKEAELQALLRTVEQIRILQHHWESQDDKTQVEERLKELMDLAQVRQDREQARELQQDLEARLEAQKRHLDAREAELTSLRAELAESVRARDEAQQQSREAVTKLEVLSSYFKERELKLQREIGVQEVQRQQKEADVGSATQRLATLEQQSASYRSQLASLKQEMEVSERNYKNQLTEQEKRAHENWLAARAAERKLEDANRETANLRQRLTLLEREQMMNKGLTQPPLPHGLLPPPPPLGRLGGPPLPPPPLHPMMGPPMFPPFPPPPPELLKRLRPSPGSFREDSPSPRSRDSRGSPPPLPHFLDPRGGPPFLPRPVRSHQASSTGSGELSWNGNKQRRKGQSVTPSDVEMLAVVHKKHERMRDSLLSWRPNARLPKLPWTAKPESNLWRNGRLLRPPRLLRCRQDRGL